MKMNYKELLEFISDRKMKLPLGEIYSGIPQSWIDEEKRALKDCIENFDPKKIFEDIKNEV